MAKPILAVDIDDVLFPFVAGVLADHNRRCGTAFELSDAEHFGFDRLWGGTLEEAIIEVQSFLDRDHRAVKPIAGAQEVLGRLADDYHVMALTSRSPALERLSRDWLDHHFAGVVTDLVLVGNCYTGVLRTKADVCSELGALCLVDDDLNYITQCANSGVRGVLFGNGYKWNRCEVLPSGVVRAKNWHEVERHLDGIVVRV